MKKALLVAVGLIALLAFIGFNVFRTPPPFLPSAGDVEAAAMQSSARESADAVSETGDVTARSALENATEDRLAPGSLVVEVTIGGTGAPAAGVGVQITQSDGRDLLLGQGLETTDGHGQVRFEGLSPGRVDVEIGAGRSRLTRRVQIQPGRSRHLEMRVPFGVIVDGEVVDAEGKPVAGAQVWYLASQSNPLAFPTRPVRPIPVAVTGNSGQFVIPSLLRPGFLGATAPGHAPSPLYYPRQLEGEPRERYSSPPVESAPASELRVGLRIQLGASPGHLSGVVSGEDGLPLAGAHIDLLPEAGRSRQIEEGHFVIRGQSQHILTNASGEFSLDVPPNFRLMIRAQGHVAYSEEMEIPPGSQEEVTIALLPGRRVFGHVKSTAGKALPGARVFTSSGHRAVATRTAADGSFRIDLPPGVAVRIYADEDDHLGAVLEVLPESMEPIRWDPELAPMARLRGRVMDEVGRPLGSWDLEVRPPTQPYRSPYRPLDVEIGEDGRFDVGVLPEKPYVLNLKEPGQWLAIDLSHVGEVYGDQSEIVVVVDASKRASASVEGILRDAAGQPIADASLQLYDGPKTALLDLQTSETGHFFVGPLMPRHYRLTVWGSAHNLSRIDVLEFDLAAEEHLDLGDISIAPAGTLNVTIVRRDGETVQDLDLSAHVISDKDEETIVSLDATGRGSVRLPAGTYDLTVFSTGFMHVHRKVNLVANRATDALLTIQSGQTISLEISFSDSSELERGELAWVTVTYPSGDSSHRRHVAIIEGKLYWHDMPLADGTPRPLNYSAILAPGAYGLEIETETGHSFRGSLTVRDRAGETAPIPVVVSPVRR